ncbi:GNAT family N-acetyltransferase [Paenibacillus sp. 1001270B_150601_E10]|uniref:GNAT family N-acetyltransferase n=1 Tax=Paenibacillus sp. 1001270B_150601_E10 TaxID=2787079 RepID=UPI00189CA26A|nr:GNAT family N-acetyltransferase [Paenibacillus sp. 1001270B_150601_E10]
MLRLRKPKRDDASIHKLIVEELIPQSNLNWDPDQVREDLPERLKQGVTYVKAERGKFMGFIHAMKHQDCVVIDMLAVHSRYQGTGVGSKLLQKAEQYGKQEKCSHAVLLTDFGNEQAKQFYLRKGYSITGFLPSVICYEMKKELFP